MSWWGPCLCPPSHVGERTKRSMPGPLFSLQANHTTVKCGATTRGMSHQRAIAEMLQQPHLYESRLVAPLKTLEVVKVETIMRVVGVHDLFPGMVLAEDIRTKTGGLVLAKGYEVTSILIERLRSYGKRVDIVEPFRVLIQVPQSEQRR